MNMTFVFLKPTISLKEEHALEKLFTKLFASIWHNAQWDSNSLV